MLGFFAVGGAFTGQAQKLSNKQIKTWTIYEGKGGGRAGKIDSYSIDSDGAFAETKGSKTTTSRIPAADLQELVKLLKDLKLPGTKTKIVKGDGIYDGVYGGLTITLDGKKYKIEGNSFYAEKQLVLLEGQKQTLDRLKRKLTEIRAAQLTGQSSVRDEIPMLTDKLWTLIIFRREDVYEGLGCCPTEIKMTIVWRGKLARRGNSSIFDAVWQNETTGEEVRDTVELEDSVRDSVVLRRDGDANKFLGTMFRGKYIESGMVPFLDAANKGEELPLIWGHTEKSDLLWVVKSRTEAEALSKIEATDTSQANPPTLRSNVTVPLDPAKEKMVFRYENGPYKPRNTRSWYIDEQGNIYEYSYKSDRKSFIIPPTLVGHVAPKILAAKRKLIERAAKGNLTFRRGPTDTGSSKTVAFLANIETGEYREIALSISGTAVGINNTPEAMELLKWLQQVVSKS